LSNNLKSLDNTLKKTGRFHCLGARFISALKD